MSKLKVEDILWSRNPSPLRQAIKKISFPAMLKVAAGYDSADENESLARDQVVRIHQVHTQTRVLANVKKNIFLSIPLRYSDARFETSNSKVSKKDKKDKTPSEKSKPMYLRDVVDKSQFPRDVQFFAGDDLSFALQLKNNTVSEKFSSITLKNMYEVTYLQGNSIFHNHLDTMVVNIPLYAPIDVYIAEGFKTSTPEKWNKYQSLLGKLVGKHVTFELYPGNQNITYFNEKRLDKAKTQSDYETIAPTGNLVITAGNARLKQNQRKTGSAGASKTLGASAAGNAQVPTNRKAPLAPSSNSNNSTFQGGTPNDRRHSLLDEMEANDDRRMANAGATVPRSILRQEAKKHAAAEAAGTRSMSPARSESVASEDNEVMLGEDAALLHKRLMLRRQSTSDVLLAPTHTGITHTPEQAQRKHSTPVAPLQLQSQWQREQHMQDSPRSNGSHPSFEYSASAGSPSPMHTSGSTPSSGGADARSRRISAAPQMYRQSSSVISGSSDNAFSSGLAPPVDIPAPDYDGAPPLPSKSLRNPMISSHSMPESSGPPAPPPISTIPSRTDRQTSMPNRPIPAPPSSNGPPPPPGGGPPAPPPPPGVPPPPGAGPPPPPGPPPPIGGPPAPPPPPPPGPGIGGSAPAAGGLAAGIANARLKPATERAERPPPPKEDESPMGSMMKELRAVQNRRKSMGDVLVSDNVEKMSTGSSGSGSEQTEFQKAMDRRKLGNFNAGPRPPPNILPKATTPKPARYNANNSPRNNFIVNNNNTGRNLQSMNDVPKDLTGLTVSQIGQVLKLLNLGKYEARFKEHFIDGEMMGTLNAEMLKSDLGCTSQLDINKIMRFIQGWRPK